VAEGFILATFCPIKFKVDNRIFIQIKETEAKLIPICFRANEKIKT